MDDDEFDPPHLCNFECLSRAQQSPPLVVGRRIVANCVTILYGKAMHVSFDALYSDIYTLCLNHSLKGHNNSLMFSRILKLIVRLAVVKYDGDIDCQKFQLSMRMIQEASLFYRTKYSGSKSDSFYQTIEDIAKEEKKTFEQSKHMKFKMKFVKLLDRVRSRLSAKAVLPTKRQREE